MTTTSLTKSRGAGHAGDKVFSAATLAAGCLILVVLFGVALFLVIQALPALVEENKAKIGRFIEDRINDWHADKFATEMEREIGRDLQFIRINGTVVGGLVGLFIYTVSHALK